MAVKLSEDGTSVVLRAVELEGQSDRLRADDGAIDVPARGIVTALLSADDLRGSDGLER